MKLQLNSTKHVLTTSSTMAQIDKATEKSINEEISALVFDSQEKVKFVIVLLVDRIPSHLHIFQVTLKLISNNWSITNEQAQQVLTKWIAANAKSGKTLKKEFLVRGTNSKGILSFGVVTEDNKSKLSKKWTNFSAWIYSVDATVNARKIGIPDLKDIKV